MGNCTLDEFSLELLLTDILSYLILSTYLKHLVNAT